MKEMSQVKIIKGEGTYPTPEVRRIYPTRALLWKYYLTVFLIWVFVSIGFILLGWFIQFVADEPKPANFEIVFTVIYWAISFATILPSLILLPLYVNRMEFIVHGNEVIVKKGLVNRTIKYCPYRTVTNISTTAGPLDRLLGIGCVNIQTAGKGGATGPEEKLEGLPLYHEIRDYILRQLRIYYRAVSGSEVPTHDETDLSTVQREMVNELRDIKRLLKNKKI
ncbi:MAG: PH domain-containing protein [Candidatus Heimdallarchaeota archaeon]|nr:MAG: PH domain-containing protein [Candidatus Heimdallarchaeota archaeon]